MKQAAAGLPHKITPICQEDKMSTVAIPQSVQNLFKDFRDCFTKPSFENFVALITGWISCQGRHSISRVIQAAGHASGGKHHSCFYRFLASGRWTIDAVGQVLFRLLLPFLPSEITLILDDTLGHKTGPHIFGAAMHYDSHRSTYGRGTSEGSKSFFAFGHNWVVAAVWVPLPFGCNRGLAIPFLFRLYRSAKRCPKNKYRKRTELALQLINLVARWLPKGRKLHVVTDSEYACKTIVRCLPVNVAFTGPMVMDAAVYAKPKPQTGRGRPRRKGKKLPSPKKLAKSRTRWKKLAVTIYGKKAVIKVKTMLCLWYTVAGTRSVRMVLTRDPRGRINDRAYFSTDVDASTEAILEQFARRWEIEVAFRNTKQAMGLQDPQNGWWRRANGTSHPKKRPGPNPRGRIGEKAIKHTLATAFVSYALTVLWYLRHGNAKADVARVKAEAPWYLQKVHPSFNDMLASMRREIWTARLSQHPGRTLGAEEIDRLLPHWLLAA